MPASWAAFTASFAAFRLVPCTASSSCRRASCCFRSSAIRLWANLRRRHACFGINEQVSRAETSWLGAKGQSCTPTATTKLFLQLNIVLALCPRLIMRPAMLLSQHSIVSNQCYDMVTPEPLCNIMLRFPQAADAWQAAADGCMLSGQSTAAASVNMCMRVRSCLMCSSLLSTGLTISTAKYGHDAILGYGKAQAWSCWKPTWTQMIAFSLELRALLLL